MPPSTPRVVAHRGASAVEPEHTLAAYVHALETGTDGLECDVRLTADGHLVCVHDRTVDRTSNGSGLVSTLELTDLEGLDWGSWKKLALGAGAQPDVPDRVGPGDRAHLLSLKRLLSLVADSGRRVEVAIETKHPTRYGGLVERTLVETLEHFGWAKSTPGNPSPVRVMSFSLLATRRMRLLAPTLPLVLLMERMPLPYRDGSLPRGVMAAGIGVRILRAHPGYVARAHAQGHEVHVWTVDTPDDIDRCLETGVDVIITNRPADVLARLGRSPSGG
ncbi:glycerophosphodiester phosphodiesterase family protein [Kineosporia sp. A_224]|uniref:glycerophosphodiester phosphodiesterase n=1 Tax=Kineosporia sp. A_224 TaxID=1962180 RepID=UPI001E6102A0|nr:glycerophosphodiester phosphodiesterase family protein [Kineosporia sp. A_224]